ncbi:MAG: 1-acyl-sn-glycerol-3-phosphate acyltransferase [Clostridia bacterium]|nr:1-acyl-sn-glycerol-3-phosphate acyltransferase [Clostridia bacterium]MBQ6931218.1 1-acyl-sn-glycerol-3-phosphate acyltransferase [Clostridia bacterium]MBQ7101732.1 1-acyl-sn-glycerol-3-phosphate acyltransferase [Clostridia bacterium]
MSFDYSVVKDRKYYDVVKGPCKFLLKLGLRIKCEGVENIPKEGAFILASNHIHFVDPAVLLANFPRPIHFMAKVEAFKYKITAFLLTHLNTFPVSRGRSDKASIDYAVKLIENGCVMGIFPEGTRSKDLKPHKAKAGVALIARQTKADILPCSIYCDKKGGLFRKVTVRYGELIKYEELGLTEESSTKELRAAADKIMEEIVDLWEEKHCD